MRREIFICDKLLFSFFVHRPVVPPLSLATTFKQFAPGQHAGFDYSRTGNPTRQVLEKCLNGLDGSKYSLTFASGMGTMSTIVSILKTGDSIITNDDHYVGTRIVFETLAVNMGIKMIYIDMTNLKNLEQVIVEPNVKMVWMETPTNPTMKVIDIKAVAEIVHTKSKAILVVDNTILTAYFQRPHDLGADVAVYSLSKYEGGHSDALMGALTTNDEKLYEKLKHHQNAIGGVPSPFDCYMVIRGLKTLSLRMDRHFENSVEIARFLESHPKVEKVLHPALPTHPQHELAKSQQYGHSGMMAFYIKDATLSTATTFLKTLKIFMIGAGFGGTESLVGHPVVVMAHPSITVDEYKKYGVTDGLIRMSVGIADVEDLIADLEQAFAVI